MKLKQPRGRREFIGAALKTTGALAVASSTSTLLSGCMPPESATGPDTVGTSHRTAGSPHQAEMSASEALEQMRQGHMSAESYIGALLDRAQSQRSLNALITLNDTGALDLARRIDAARSANKPLGPLAGLALVINDNINTAGVPTSSGTPGLRDFTADSQCTSPADLAREGRDPDRQGQYARAGSRRDEQQRSFRRGPESLRGDADPRRGIRRDGRGACRAHGAGRPGYRCVRVAACAGRALRRRGIAAECRQRWQGAPLSDRGGRARLAFARYGRDDGAQCRGYRVDRHGFEPRRLCRAGSTRRPDSPWRSARLLLEQCRSRSREAVPERARQAQVTRCHAHRGGFARYRHAHAQHVDFADDVRVVHGFSGVSLGNGGTAFVLGRPRSGEKSRCPARC